MAEYSSQALNFSLKTPLGEDELIVSSFSGTECISSLYTYTCNAWSTNPEIDFDAIIEQPVSLSILLPDNSKRYISGYVNRINQTSQGTDLTNYQLRIVPWLWFLTQRANCRIFQDNTVPEIIQQIFDDRGYSGLYTLALDGSYQKREYCVQYRETDFNFVSRLMEKEGICYFFKHGDGENTLILGDSAAAHKPIVPAGDVAYYLAHDTVKRHEGVVNFSFQQSVRPTAITLQDFNFKTPSTDLEVNNQKTDDRELYDYPGEYPERSIGDTYAKIRLEEERSIHKVYSGETTSRRLAAGSTFKMTDHPRNTYNILYLLTSVSISASQHETDTTFTSYFECIPADTPFRPQMVTHIPAVYGLQTAIVVGPSGEEIWLDPYGRVKVQFHWDREGKYDEKSSCWVRVAQNWAGKNWGIVFHPRIGQEVVVQFIEGNVDRPLITGRVYNEEQMPPYELPANSTQSTIKSRSSKGGMPDNFNEIRFEDKKGEEHLLIHAEKDQMIEVENDETHWVGHDRNKTIDNNETTLVKGNRTETVEKNETITINQNRDETVQKNESVQVNENRSHTIAKKDTLDIGKEWMVNVGEKIIIQCGKSSISMKKDGTIQIVGKDIKVQGSGRIDVKASKDIVMKGKGLKQN